MSMRLCHRSISSTSDRKQDSVLCPSMMLFSTLPPATVSVLWA